MKNRVKALIIIPCYNEGKNIERVIKDLNNYVSEVDYVIINDGSTDNSLEIIKLNNYNYINCVQNMGLFGAVQTGFQYALMNNYDVAIQFDGDGQHKAKYINKMITEINNGSDIVIGSRFINNKKPFNIRMMGSRIISFVIKLVTFKTIKDPTSGLRAYNKSVIEDYASDINNPPEPDTLVYMLLKKRKIKEIQVEMDKREYGETIFNFKSSVKYMIRIVISILFIQPFRKRK